MRALALFALAALAIPPLSAQGALREPHRMVVEAPHGTPLSRWEVRHHRDRWEDRWEHRGCDRRLRSVPRPLGPPFGGGVPFYCR